MLAGDTAIAQDARLTFSLRAEGTRFSAGDSVEIATADGAMTTSVTSGRGLTVQDDRIAVVSVEPGKALGVSAHGPLKWRLVQGGVAGDWVPLTTLVRTPALAGVACKETCTLTGTDLFLIEFDRGECWVCRRGSRAGRVHRGFARGAEAGRRDAVPAAAGRSGRDGVDRGRFVAFPVWRETSRDHRWPVCGGGGRAIVAMGRG